MKRLWTLLALVVLLAGLVPAALAQGPIQDVEVPAQAPQGNVSTGVNPNAGVESLTGSYVAFDPSVGGDTCFIAGAAQTLCFRAESYSPDWEYVYNVWQRFPTDWTVNNVYVQGTPYCDQGGTWGTFSWAFQTSPYEVNIAHPRYQANNPAEHCVAYYCFEVTSGSGTPDALESWYWDGDGYNAAPHNPCSSDGYTPSGQNACDQAVNPPAAVPPCSIDPGLYLLPPAREGSSCNGTEVTYSFALLNQTGADGTFDLTYSVPTANGTLTGPAQLTVVNGATQGFDVLLTTDLCAEEGDLVLGVIDAAGNSYTDQSVISHTIAVLPSWEAVDGSAPSWAGGGYPRDGCTAQNAAGDWVTYLIGDMSGITGFWGYNHDTNTWALAGATGTPADRWAPDWAYDEATNLCYLTGGANTPGGGTYNEAYVFDPVANAFTALPSFTSIRDFHNSWVGTIDGVKYLCIGGGVNASSVLVQATQCYDIAAGTWGAENALMAAFPTDPFGAADGILHAPTGDQFWYVGGAINNFANVTDEARYWDDADNAWHQAGNTGVARYRVEGDFLDGSFYQVGGSSGGFTPTAEAVRGDWDGSTWVWTVIASANNIRMDNIVNAAGGTIWSVDGYGASAAAYVEYLAFCPACTGFTAWKDAPAEVQSGDVMSYTITVQAALADGLYMVDPLPAGVEYAGSLTWTAGTAWYSPTANTVYWEYNDKVAGTPAAPPAPVSNIVPVADVAGGTVPDEIMPAGPVAYWSYPEAVLWDNGPLVTHPGGGYNGEDASVLQTALGLSTYGFGNQFSYGYRMSDQFTVTDPGGWQLDTATFFAYQTGTYGYPPASTLTGAYLQIWDGPPWAGGSVIWGDLVTNVMVSTAWPEMYRVLDTAMLNTQRPPMTAVAAVNLVLPPGTYWLDWTINGSGSSGPWAPPISIVGETTTGDAYQYTTAWALAVDTGLATPQGMPFILEGSIIGGGEQVEITFDVTVTAYCGETIVNVAEAGNGTDVVTFEAETDVLGEPEIEVAPPALWAELCPDTTAEQTLEICNVGTCDLVWELREETQTVALAPVAPRAPYAGRPVELSLAGDAVSVETNPPTVDAPVQLILDDGSRDNDIGIGGTLEFIWVNRFTPNADEFPFTLNQVQFYFSSVGLVNVGDDIIIVVYENTTGGYDPAPGSNWLLSYPTTVQALDTWNVYDLPAPVELNGPGDVIIGAIALEVPGTSYWPASIDQTTTQQRSWAGWWSASPPPDPPLLPPDTSWVLIDDYFPGNWMVRGYGETGGSPPVDVLWLSEDPTAGTVLPGECQVVTVTFDATGMTPGDYMAYLFIDSNDADEPEVIVPVTMTVSSGAEILTVTTDIAALTVTFTAEVNGPDPLDYMWDFGDGIGTSTETNPVYTYAEGGCYTVTLDVDSACGGDSWQGQVCVVAACEPVTGADFTWAPTTPLVAETVYFTGTVAAGTAPIAYAWDFGDGDVGAGEFVNHAYAAAGTYVVWMTATNDCGEDYATYDVVVVEGCVAPSGVDFTWLPLNPLAGDAVTFTGTVAAGTEPFTYAWAFGDGGTGTGSPIDHTFAVSGTYPVVLTVTNACGEATATYDVVVTGETPPVTYYVYLPLIIRP